MFISDVSTVSSNLRVAVGFVSDHMFEHDKLYNETSNMKMAMLQISTLGPELQLPDRE